MRGRSVAMVAPFVAAILLLLSLHRLGPVTAQKQKPSDWQTLSGNAPLVIARGGFSGLFPDSGTSAYQFAIAATSLDTILWCDVQLTKDGVGICLPDINLQNSTDIFAIYPAGKRTYLVNGVRKQGWFSVDYTMKDLSQVSLYQGIYSRTDKFDGNDLILPVENVTLLTEPQPSLWLNIQHDLFYRQHNLSMRSYVLSVTKKFIISYVSSPEVGFLSSISARFKGSQTNLVFRFLGEDMIEPSTNQTYRSLLNNLTFIKTFASGIIVPKHYIWPVTSDLYLQTYNSIVTDAHKEGLEIFAADFANDGSIPYNYSYDPFAECLSYIDNGVFSVDGLLTDFPITPSEAIGCFSHIGKNSSKLAKPLVISHYGASAVYPDCTDLAYKEAVEEGADYIDCPVQVTQDGIFICMSSINLIDDTSVTTSPFRSRTNVIPGIAENPGIFTFNLTWEEIQKNLTPVISSPYFHDYHLVRNPRYKNVGKYMRLSDFLAFAKSANLSGVVIIIENAAFLAEKLGYSVTDAVITALNDTGYSNQTAQEVMIQSTDSSVLIKFKQETKYRLVYEIDESIRDAVTSSISDIKSFAHAVAIGKTSIYPESEHFLVGETGLPKKLQAAGLSVYVYLFQNEYVSQAWDFFADPIVEINTFVQNSTVDGIITDSPKASATYKRSKCANLGNNMPTYALPIEAGALISLIVPGAQPPALAPMPALNPSDVVEPPLPPATPLKPSAPPAGGGAPLPHTSPPSSGPRCTAASMFLPLAMFLGALLI